VAGEAGPFLATAKRCRFFGKVKSMDDTYLVYSVSYEVFRSRLASDINEAFDVAVQMAFGEMPDPKETNLFDEFVSFKNDFENESFWREGRSIWETDFSTGYVVIVKVQTLLN
jgi:hypothetical protein